MYTPIEKMPDTSRIWIYQSNRTLQPEEVQLISNNLRKFCDQWQVHGADMNTSFDVEYNRFIVLAVDEEANTPSGCSIDSSVHILKALEQQIQADFFSREEVVFVEGDKIVTHPLQQLKKLFSEGTLHEHSVTLNTLVQALGEWRHASRVKVSETWLKRYLPKVPVS